MKKHNIERDLAFYKGFLFGHKNALMMINGDLYKQIDYLEKKVEKLEAQYEKRGEKNEL